MANGTGLTDKQKEAFRKKGYGERYIQIKDEEEKKRGSGIYKNISLPEV